MKRSWPNKWNDWLALLVVVGMPVIWVFAPNLNDTVLGATITGWTTVLFFYFRKSPSEADPPPVPHG